MITELGAARSLRSPWRSLSSPPTCVLASQHSSASRVISFGFIYPAKARSSLTLSARCVADRTQFSWDFRFAMADSPADIERALDVLRETTRPEKLFRIVRSVDFSSSYILGIPALARSCVVLFHYYALLHCTSTFTQSSRTNDLRALFVSQGNLYTPYTLEGPENPHVSRPVFLPLPSLP